MSLPKEFNRTRNIVGMVDYLPGQDWTIRLDSLLQTLGDHWRQQADPADVLYLSGDGERIDVRVDQLSSTVWTVYHDVVSGTSNPICGRRNIALHMFR